MITAVYFDQRMGALHVVHSSKLSFLASQQVFPSISVTNGEKDEKA